LGRFFYFRAMRNTQTLNELKIRLERYCAYQERCHQEVQTKLRQLGAFRDDSDTVISHLIQNDYLNETRFTMLYVRSKFSNKKWGKKRIINELKQRKITSYNIDKALAQISEENYRMTFETLAEKRWNQLKRNKEPLKQRKKKWISYLQYRGWENDLIFDALNKLT
jgi:regulatory protein